MSMSEFERELNKGEDDSPCLSMQEHELPDDFSPEDMAFAQELETLFAIPEEEVPPYFVQTLLEPEDPRFQVVEHGFEQKTSARVFRRLNLKRRLYRSQHPSLRGLMPSLSLRRSVMVLMAACLLFMFITMAATATSFASGMAILLAGPHSGVSLWSYYPGQLSTQTKTQQPSVKEHETLPHARRINLAQAQQQLHFPMYWPQEMPDNYTLSTVSLYGGSDHPWADGPILELNYTYTAHGISPRGAGQITICEFKPVGKVLQAVHVGSAHMIQVQLDSKTNSSAIYVDGQWVRINKYAHDWRYGVRSELIYERDGVVFWIVGDQRDGIDNTVLGKIASSLQVFNVHVNMHLLAVTEPTDDSTWLFADDVVYLDSGDTSSLETSLSGEDTTSSVRVHSR